MVDPGSPLRMRSCANHFGTQCNFSCAIGYRLNGSSTVTCVAPGNKHPGVWNNAMPMCEGKQEKRKKRQVTRFKHFVKIESFLRSIFCRNFDFFITDGNNTNICLCKVINIFFSLFFTFYFYIVINCTSLTQMVDPGGPLRMSSCANQFGTQCNFSCAFGYRLNGSSTVTCVAPGNQHPGVWNNTIPTCEGKQEKRKKRRVKKTSDNCLFQSVANVLNSFRNTQ